MMVLFQPGHVSFPGCTGCFLSLLMGGGVFVHLDPEKNPWEKSHEIKSWMRWF